MKIIERNLQEIGKSLFVSLPMGWVRNFKLKKGSKVKLVQTNQGMMTISPELVVDEKPKETTLEYDPNFNRKFFREYFMGNEKITIMVGGITPKERMEVHEFLKRFMSVQVIDELKSKIVVKSFKIEELTIEECLRRLYYLSASMLEELDSGDVSLFSEIRANMTRFYYMLVMQIRRFLDEGKYTRENQISLIRAMDFRMVAEKIQRVGELLAGLGKSKNVVDSQLVNKISKIYEKVFFYFLNESYSRASKVWEDLELLEKKKLDPEVVQILRYIKEISGLIR